MAEFCGPCEDDMFGFRTKYTKWDVNLDIDKMSDIMVRVLCENCGHFVTCDLDGNPIVSNPPDEGG